MDEACYETAQLQERVDRPPYYRADRCSRGKRRL